MSSRRQFSTLLSKFLSFQGNNQTTFVQGERLFRSALDQSSKLSWFSQQSSNKNAAKSFTGAGVPSEFRAKHGLLTLHIWLLNRRLVKNNLLGDKSTQELQENIFESLWQNTTARIRQAGVKELMVNKHLKDIQQETFALCLHLDDAFTIEEHNIRRAEVAGILFKTVYLELDSIDPMLCRELALYTETEHEQLVNHLPEDWFKEGRIGWGAVPFTMMRRGSNIQPELDRHVGEEELPVEWRTALTDAGETYYWNEQSMAAQWEKPSSSRP